MAGQRERQLLDAVDRLCERMASGEGDQVFRDYLKASAAFWRYSPSNVGLILWQCPTATRVAGFRAWKKLGRYVRKGEKGIAILVPWSLRKRRQEAEAEGDEAEEIPERVTVFRVGHVFDVAQTDGEEVPSFQPDFAGAEGLKGKLEAFAAGRGWSVEYGPVFEAQGFAAPGGVIRIQEAATPGRQVQTLAHEVAHQLLHLGPEAGRLTSKQQELEAEAAAAVVLEWAGFDKASNAAGYCLNHGAKPADVRACLGRILGAAKQVIAFLAGEAEGQAERAA